MKWGGGYNGFNLSMLVFRPYMSLELSPIQIYKLKWIYELKLLTLTPKFAQMMYLLMLEN